MKILLSTFGSAGDVYPLVGLALALRELGAEPALAVNAHFRPLVENQQLAFHELGTAAQYEATLRHPDVWHPVRAFPHLWRNVHSQLRRQYELHCQYPAGVSNSLGLGALLAQEHRRIPVVSVHMQPGVLWSDRAPPLLTGFDGPRWLRRLLHAVGERFVVDRAALPDLNAWRQELRLPPIRRLTRWWHSPRGVVCLFPSWFCPAQPDWPSPLVQTGFPLWSEPARSTRHSAEPFRDGLVFTPGSANAHAREFFRAAAQACRLLDRPGLFLTSFPEQVPAGSGCEVRRYAPLEAVLPGAAAFIHHGGIGSVSQGLAAGIPQLVVPLAFDQFDNGARVADLGAGEVLAPSSFTGPRVAAALRRLMARGARRFEITSALPAAAQAVLSLLSPNER